MTLSLILNVFAVFLLMTPGFILRRREILSADGMAQLARFCVLGAAPCLMFNSVVRNYTLSTLLAAWPLPVGIALIFIVGWLVGQVVVRWVHFPDPAQRRAFLFQTAFNNYVFLPLPLIALLFDEKAIAALLISSLGAEAVIWTLGLSIARGVKLRRDSWRNLVNPVLLSMVAAVVVLIIRDLQLLPDALVTAIGPKPWDAILNTVRMIGQATVPVAMTVAGGAMATLHFDAVHNARVWTAAAVRLLLVPVLLLAALSLLPLTLEQYHVLCVVAVMPSAIASITFSKVYGMDEHFSAGTVLLTHLGAIATVPLLLRFVLR